MTIPRRDFLVGAGLSALASCAPRARALTTAPGWAAVKAEFGLAPELSHMSGFFLASHPRSVRAAIELHRRGLDANPYEYVEHNVARLETAVRAAASDYLGCAADDLAFTDSTTQGLGIVYGGFQLAPGKEILATTHDHLVTTLACRYRAERSGSPFRQLALYDDPARATVAAIVDRLVAGVRPETRIVALTWVHSGTGVKLPIRAIADALGRINATRGAADRIVLCVDGVHGFGIEDTPIPELGCDFFVAGCHKWLFGPRGTGLVWGRRDAWPLTTPSVPSIDPMWRTGDIPPAALMTPGGFHSFEHRWALDAAFRFHLDLGKSRIATRVHDLNRHVKEELARMPRVTVVTPRSDELSAGITCFSVANRDHAEVVKQLRERSIVATVTPPFYSPAYVRLSAGLVTVEADVDAALAAVRAL